LILFKPIFKDRIQLILKTTTYRFQMFPIFNKQFQIVQDLGTGATSKVYLAQSLSNPAIKVAIKIYNR